MKQRLDELNLRSAFPAEPESCHAALMQAACSVREDEPVKRVSIRVILVTAILILAMTAVAVAAVSGELNQLFQKYYSASVPEAAIKIMAETPHREHQVGPLTFTVEELLSDGRVNYLTASVKTTDGSPAVLLSGALDPYDRIGENLAKLLAHEDITATTTYADASIIAGVPLYNVMAWIQPDDSVMAGEEMADGLVQEDGSVLLIDMLYTDPEKVGEKLKGKICMMAYEMHPETFENLDDKRWTAEQAAEIAVSGVTAEKTYKPTGNAALCDLLSVTEVRAQQTCAGVYLTIYTTASKEVTARELMDSCYPYAKDADGEYFPVGISLTGEFLDGSGQAFPQDFDYEHTKVDSMAFLQMIGLDYFPDTIMITDILGTPVMVE